MLIAIQKKNLKGEDLTLGWLSSWQYRKSHTITGTADGAQTDYQIGIKVYYGSGTDGTEAVSGATFGKVYCDSKCKTDFGDIRFTQSDGSTELSYWIETSTASTSALIWVEVNSIPASPDTTTIYMYYGKSTATTTSSISSTFVFGDDAFASGWEKLYGSVDWSVSGGVLQIAGDSITSDTTVANSGYPDGAADIRFITRTRYLAGGSYHNSKWGFESNSAHPPSLACGYELASGAKNLKYVGHDGTTEYWGSLGSITFNINTWYNCWFTYVVSSKLIKGYWDYTLINNYTFPTALTAPTYVCFEVFGVTQEWDYVAVGKFTTNEPTHTSWGSEESSTAVIHSVLVSLSRGGALRNHSRFRGKLGITMKCCDVATSLFRFGLGVMK